MKHLLTTELIPGMVVGEDVVTSDYHLVFPKGTVLTDIAITKLELYGILSIAVQNNRVPAPMMEDNPPTYSERIKKTPEFQEFKKNYNIELASFKDMINLVVEKNIPLDVSSLIRNALKVISTASVQVSVLDMLQNMREFDDSTYAHSLNVGLLCNILAGWLNLSPAEVEMATACGILHDVGKLLVPREIITKPDKLTEEEFTVIKRHPVDGYQLLKKQQVDSRICNAALMHHERFDGSGYPLGIQGNKIDSYARLVAICDVYDAMTANRCYRGAICPFKVIEIFEEEGLQKYDGTFVLTFLEHAANSYINSRCRLSDGRRGVIVFINNNCLFRPVVKCGKEYVDLVKYTDLRVTAIL